MKRYRPRSTPLAYVHPSAVTYSGRQIRRRSIPEEIAHKEQFQRALTFLQTGEVESAEAVCAGLLEQYPEDANFLCLSARALVQLGRFPEAHARIEGALTTYPEFAIAHEVRGELLLAKGGVSAAAEAFQKALKLDPERQQTRMKLVQVLLQMGRTEEAQALQAEIMESSQDNQDIAKAGELEKEGKHEEAEKLYRQILTRHPDNVSAMRLWARLGIEQEKYAGAEKLLQQAVKVAPGFGRAWADLCTVQYEQEKYDDVIENAKRLIKLSPRAPDGHIWLASASASAGHHHNAIESFDAALNIAPDHVGALCAKGNACRTIGD
ncbi:MAG: tetratricopeptide repeat protein, partial [Proteobacteria bacterium]|nr:tetratricopeptide repeat protein [Pseudomonadota bacterium]